MPRNYPSRPVVSAAAITLCGDSVLLVRRGTPPNLGQWSFPGGAVELGETCRQCARRETLEETGVPVDVLALVDVVDKIFTEDGRVSYHYVIVDYLARPKTAAPQPAPRPADDAAEAKWVPLAQLDRYDIAPPGREVLAKAVRIREEGAC